MFGYLSRDIINIKIARHFLLINLMEHRNYFKVIELLQNCNMFINFECS